MRCSLLIGAAAVLVLPGQLSAQVERVWLTHQATDTSKLTVNWTTKAPGDSKVRFGPTKEYGEEVRVPGSRTLHHVEVPLPKPGTAFHYSVSSGDRSSPDHTFKGYPTDVLRVAVVANWQGKPDLKALLKDDPHLLVTAGDNVPDLWHDCGAGTKDCWKPYAALVDKYPDLFRSVPFMPALGNHDREIRPRGPKPPAEVVYDIEATAFRTFFPLPGDGWKWHLDVPGFGVRFVALDLNHVSDRGTTWQTCHDFGPDSAQFKWYRVLMEDRPPGFVVTLYNERNTTVRGLEKGAWKPLIQKGTVAVSGFGYFGEYAEADGFSYWNTSLSGKGDKYPDPQSKVFKSEDNYLLVAVDKKTGTMTVELKSLGGEVLARKEYKEPAAKPKPLPQSTDWPRWRGPNADGVAESRNLPVKWSKTENVLWSAELPGWGTSSPVVYGDRVFVTSQVTTDGKKSLLTLCFDRTTGKELWRHDFGFGVDQKVHAKSNLAVNTPAVTADAVYVAFGNADVARYTHDGKLVWVQRYLKTFDDPKMSWGYAVSPLVLDDSVLFPWNHHKGPCHLIGLDKKTGEIGWKKDRPIGTAHATPLLVSHHGQTDILVPGQNRLTAFDAKTHAEVWKYGAGEGPYNGEIISSPVYGDGLVFLQLWRESKIHAVRLRGDGKPPEPVWVSAKAGPVEPSLLYYRGLVYAMMDDGVLVALDGKTGKEHYRERLKGTFNSSPVAGNGHVYASNNDGVTFVVKAGVEFEVVNTNNLGERISASPAITGDAMIFRTDSHLYCVGTAAKR